MNKTTFISKINNTFTTRKFRALPKGDAVEEIRLLVFRYKKQSLLVMVERLVELMNKYCNRSVKMTQPEMRKELNIIISEYENT